MRASDCEVIGTSTTVIDGQVVQVTRYDPTAARKQEADHNNLSFHKRRSYGLTGTKHRGPTQEVGEL